MQFLLTLNEFSPNFNELDNLPIIFLGFNIKSVLDFDITIPKKYNPIYFKHFSKINCDIYKDFYYYGIKLNINKKHEKLLDKLNTITKNNDIITLETYKIILKQHNLKCNTCFRHFNIGCFPLDLCCLSQFVDVKNINKIIIDFLNLKNNNIGNLAGLHLFILTDYPRNYSTYKIINFKNY